VESRRQALQLCLAAAVVVIVKILYKLDLELLKRIKSLQVEKLAFEQAEEILHHGIVQTVAFSAHALANAFLSSHSLVLPVLVLPALV